MVAAADMEVLCCTGHTGTAASPLAAASSVLSKKDALIAQINSPAHLAAKQLMYDRERRVGARIDARLEELRQLLHETQLPEELRVRALIEEKQLKLLAVQKKVRHRIASELRYEMQLVGADDPSLYRRSSKKHTKQTVSKSERQKESEEQVPHTHTHTHHRTRTRTTHKPRHARRDSRIRAVMWRSSAVASVRQPYGFLPYLFLCGHCLFPRFAVGHVRV